MKWLTWPMVAAAWLGVSASFLAFAMVRSLGGSTSAANRWSFVAWLVTFGLVMMIVRARSEHDGR